MLLHIGSESIEMKDAIKTVQINIRWLKRRIIAMSQIECGKNIINHYTQRLETEQAQEALLTCFLRHPATKTNKKIIVNIKAYAPSKNRCTA